MAVVDFNWNPSHRELRVFSALLILFCAIVASVGLFGTISSPAIPIAIFSTGAVLGTIGLLSPALIRYVYIAWMVAVSPIAIVVSNTVLIIVFFGVVWPTAALLRLKQRDALLLRFDRTAKSYWVAREPARDQRSYFRQF